MARRNPSPSSHPTERILGASPAIRRQHAKSWELRAGMNRSRLWQQQGKRHTARELLIPIYAWFIEGLDIAALQETEELLTALPRTLRGLVDTPDAGVGRRWTFCPLAPLKAISEPLALGGELCQSVREVNLRQGKASHRRRHEKAKSSMEESCQRSIPSL